MLMFKFEEMCAHPDLYLLKLGAEVITCLQKDLGKFRCTAEKRPPMSADDTSKEELIEGKQE